MPVNTFLIGYFVGLANCNIDLLFEIFDLMAELADEKLLSPLDRIQIYCLIENYP